MSKKQKAAKARRKRAQEARTVTGGKLLRLLLKSIAFAVALSLLVLAVNLIGIPGFDRPWVQMILVLGAYLVAYPYLMREFRPRREPTGKVERDGE